MEEYIAHWWAGDLAQHYHPFDLSMAQFNKLLKLGQYLFGLIALFELVSFSTVLRKLHFVSVG